MIDGAGNLLPHTSMTQGLILFEVVSDSNGQLVDLRFLESNRNLTELNESTCEAVLGKTIREVAPNIEDHWFEAFDRIFQTGNPAHFEQYSACASGWYQVYAFIPKPGRLAVVFHQVAQPDQAQDYEKALNRIVNLINSTLNFDEIMQKCISEAAAVVNTESAVITLLAKDQWVVRYGFGVPVGMIGRTFSDREPNSSEIVRRTKRTLIINDSLTGDSRMAARQINPGSAKEHHLRSGIIQPILLKDQVVAAFHFMNSAPSTFSPAQINFVEKISVSLSFAIANARLIESLHQEINERKKIEEEILFQANLLAHVNDAIIAYDLEERVSSWNPAAERMYGWKASEVMGRTIQEILNSLDNMTKDLELQRAKFIRGEKIQAEIMHHHRNGTPFWVEVTAQGLFDVNDQLCGCVTVSRDITERKHAQEVFHQSQNEITQMMEALQDRDWCLRLALEAGKMGWFDYRPLTNELFYDQTCESVWHSTPGEHQGMDFFWASLHPDDVAPIRAAMDAAFDPNQSLPLEVEYRIRPFDGSPERWLRTTGHTIFEGEGEDHQAARLTGTLQDITEQKVAEEWVHHQNAVLEGINQILQRAMTCDSEAELGEICLTITEDLTRSKFGFIGELSPDGRFEEIALHVIDAANESPHKMKEIHFTGLINSKFGDIFRPKILAGEPFLTNDIVSYLGSNGLPEGHPPLNSFLCLPLIQGNKVTGIIGLGKEEDGYCGQDLKTLEALANTIVQVFRYKRSEQELKKSEERLILAQQSARCGTWEWDFTQKNFYWAPGFLDSSPVAPGKFDSLDIKIAKNYIHPDDFEPLIRNLMERFTHRETDWSYEHRDRRLSAGYIWVESRGKITYDEKTGKPLRMLGISIDITERKQMVEALHETAQKAEKHASDLEIIISSIAAGVIIYDTAGNIIHISEYAQKKFGYSAADYQIPHQERRLRLKMCKWDSIPYTDEDAPLYRALRGENIRDEEILILKKPDQPLWISATFTPIFDSNQQPKGVVFTFTDITTLKRRAEKSLASERELLKVTLNSLGEGVVATDRFDRIILFNEAAASLTGYSQAEAVGKKFPEVLCIYDDQTRHPIETAFGIDVLGKPILVTHDLRKTPVSINSSPIKTPEGLNVGRVTVFSDITAKLKSEQEILRTQKLESLGILAGGIAHDFNNLLAAILANIQLAMIKLEKNQDFKPYLLHTIEVTRKASDLTKQLLTFSKGGAPVKKDASLIDLIRETTEFVLQGATAKPEFTIAADLWPVNADIGQISQVIHNLIINANQAMPKGGIIQVKAENISIEEKTHLTPGKYVKITIADQGSGITKENLSKIFDPFFTTKQDGNGLGLATSYSIITRHNGYIEVESQEGAGAAFYIYLPAANPAAALTELSPEDFGSGEGLNVLIMDDEKKILHAVGEMLRYYGYRIALACDGSMAIEIYREALRTGTRFDAVVMDLTVPGGMGGQEAVTHLRDLDPNIKAIVSSGYANDPIMADYQRYGFVGMVSKPYKIAELHEILQQVIHLT